MYRGSQECIEGVHQRVSLAEGPISVPKVPKVKPSVPGVTPRVQAVYPRVPGVYLAKHYNEECN